LPGPWAVTAPSSAPGPDRDAPCPPLPRKSARGLARRIWCFCGPPCGKTLSHGRDFQLLRRLAERKMRLRPGRRSGRFAQRALPSATHISRECQSAVQRGLAEKRRAVAALQFYERPARAVAGVVDRRLLATETQGGISAQWLRSCQVRKDGVALGWPRIGRPANVICAGATGHRKRFKTPY